MKFKIQIIKEDEIINEITLPLNSGISFVVQDKRIEIDIKESNPDTWRKLI